MQAVIYRNAGADKKLRSSVKVIGPHLNLSAPPATRAGGFIRPAFRGIFKPPGSPTCQVSYTTPSKEVQHLLLCQCKRFKLKAKRWEMMSNHPASQTPLSLWAHAKNNYYIRKRWIKTWIYSTYKYFQFAQPTEVTCAIPVFFYRGKWRFEQQFQAPNSHLLDQKLKRSPGAPVIIYKDSARDAISRSWCWKNCRESELP